MSLSNVHRATVLVLMLLLVACGSPQRTAPTLTPTLAPTTVPTLEPATPEPATPEQPATAAPTPETASEPTAAPVVEATQPSFTPATYTDERAGFALDYPAEWTLDPSSQIGVRGGQALLLSPGTTPETLADGGTRVGIITYIWDPKHDIDAYVAQRKVAWDASGFAITHEEQWQLADGRTVHAFIVQTPEQPSFMLFTSVGEDYLQIGGVGDLGLIEEIAHTLRPLN